MATPTVLITGINGYVAAHLAHHLLNLSYHVRGTVRKLSSAAPLLAGPLKPYASTGALSIVQVPDITAPGAFDAAVKDVSAIAHLASPVSFHFTDAEPVIRAAVNGTKSILDSALKAGPQLKTFVYLSSIVAVRSAEQAPYTFTEKDWNNWAEPQVAAQGKEAAGFSVYSASKSAAEKAFWAFREEEKPGFTQTALNPVFIVGPPLVAPKTADAIGMSLAPIWNIFRGQEFPPPGALSGIGHMVDVRDVASQIEYAIAHPEETDGERYISSGGYATAQSLADILREAFPEAKGQIVEGTPGKGYSKEYVLLDTENVQAVDGSKAKKLLKGGKYTPHEQSVVDTARSLAHLV